MQVELVGISKRFAGVQALSDVSLTVRSGTVHGMVGENGAGKSTLGKIIAGLIEPDAGVLSIDGMERSSFRSPREALLNGITMITQEQALELPRTVAENVLLGIEPSRGGFLTRSVLRRRFESVIAEGAFEELALAADVPVRSLRISTRQKVEIARALARNARMVIMDEPTAALGAGDVDELLENVKALRARGITVVYISHNLGEVLEVADEITVLRDGHMIQSTTTEGQRPDTLVSTMLGRPASLAFPEKQEPPPDSAVELEVVGLHRPPMVKQVSLQVRRGEIVGLAGLVGSGRTEMVRAIFGADRPVSGSVTLGGARVGIKSPRAAIRNGIVMLAESRKEQGLFLTRAVKENVTMAHLAEFARAGLVMSRPERKAAGAVARDLDVKTPSIRTPVSELSGGNQQRVLFARWLLKTPRVLIVDEPTRGVDVGAKRAIYDLIVNLAAAGMAVLLVSSELEEVVGLSHRVLVVRDGRIVGEFAGEAVEEAPVLAAAFGTGNNIVENTDE